MGFYYIELDDYQDKNYHIISYGDSSDNELVLKYTNGLIKEITQEEYALLSACRGNIKSGIRTFNNLQDKIDAIINENE